MSNLVHSRARRYAELKEGTNYVVYGNSGKLIVHRYTWKHDWRRNDQDTYRVRKQ